MAAPRKVTAAASSLVAKQALGFGTGAGGDELPWDVVGEKLAELLRFLATSAQELVAQLLATLGSLARGGLAVALPAAAAVVVAVLLVCCCCCCVAAGRRRQSGMDGEEVEGHGSGDDEEDYDDGPVVRYRGGREYGSGPNKPFEY
jgi:hypothetical protein